jgi:hypothetical protein
MGKYSRRSSRSKGCITFTHKGNFDKTESLLRKNHKKLLSSILNEYGQLGVEALRSATPKDTGKTSESWSYQITEGMGRIGIVWTNSNVNDGVNIAVILQYGHGTKNGGYVKGIDYINPAMKPIFDKIAEDAWRKVVQN